MGTETITIEKCDRGFIINNDKIKIAASKERDVVDQFSKDLIPQLGSMEVGDTMKITFEQKK